MAADEIEGFLSSLLSQRELATYTESHQVDTYHTTERAGTFQVTVLRHAGHTACIFTPASRSIPFPSQLGGDAERATALLDQEGGGLLLVTGPMAAGKSTFLASFLEQSLREHDHLVALYARRQTFAFSEDHGFMLHSDIDRFSTGNGGSLPTAVGQGADVVAVDEIEGSAMLETAVSIARGIAFVTGVIAVDGLDELGEMVATATRNDRSGKLGRRLADCLIGVVEVDLAGRENGGVARIVLHEVDEAMRERIVRGEPRPFARPTAPA